MEFYQANCLFFLWAFSSDKSLHMFTKFCFFRSVLFCPIFRRSWQQLQLFKWSPRPISALPEVFIPSDKVFYSIIMTHGTSADWHLLSSLDPFTIMKVHIFSVLHDINPMQCITSTNRNLSDKTVWNVQHRQKSNNPIRGECDKW